MRYPADDSSARGPRFFENAKNAWQLRFSHTKEQTTARLGVGKQNALNAGDGLQVRSSRGCFQVIARAAWNAVARNQFKNLVANRRNAFRKNFRTDLACAAHIREVTE
jgi:hypothetical protein